MLIHFAYIGKISLTSLTVIYVPTRASLAVETKGLLFLWLAHLNNKSSVCKQISSQYYQSCQFLSLIINNNDMKSSIHPDIFLSLPTKSIPIDNTKCKV